MICSLNEEAVERCEDLYSRFRKQYYCGVNLEGMTVHKKVRDARDAGYNYIVVVGPSEVEEGTLSVRDRGEKGDRVRSISLDEFEAELRTLTSTRSNLRE